MKRTYYKTCPDCGANLDPSERCDCNENALADYMKIRSAKPIVNKMHERCQQKRYESSIDVDIPNVVYRYC